MSERLVFGYGTARQVGEALARAPLAEREPIDLTADVAPARTRREPRDWAFLGLMAFTALLYLRPQDTVTPLAFVPLAELAALTGLASMAWHRMSRGQSMTRMTPELMGVVGLGVVILFTAPFSIWPGGSVETFTGLYIKVIAIFILMVNTLSTPRRVYQFTGMIVAATSYIAFRAVFDYARGVNLVENGRVQGAVGGMFQNPNDLALNMVAVLPLAVLLALRNKGRLGRIAGVAAGLLMVGAVIASHSRSGFMGLAAMFVILGWQIGRRRPGLVAAAALMLVFAMPFTPSSYWDRVSSITSDERDDTGSREARKILLGEGVAAFLSHPLTGVGAGQFKNYDPQGRQEAWRETHNVVLQVASELGVLGLGIFLFLVYRASFAGRTTRALLRRAAGGPRKTRWGGPAASEAAVVTPVEAMYFDAHAAAMTAAMAGWFLSALFASVAYNWTFYYLLALAIAPREILIDRLATRVAATRTAAAAAWREARA